jgi:hypothetical protein
VSGEVENPPRSAEESACTSLRVTVSKVTWSSSPANFIFYLGRPRRPKVAGIRPGRAMSPLVQRQRPQSAPRTTTDQHWAMLLFESLSAGAMAVLLGFAMVMAVVGVYVIVVWPLTFWDLANTGLEKYGSWASTVVWSVFAGGSLAGCWCFSGAAFKTKSAEKRTGARVRSRRMPQ